MPISIANDVDGPWIPALDGRMASGFGLQALGITTTTTIYSIIIQWQRRLAVPRLLSGTASDFDAAAASRRSIGMLVWT